MLDYLFALPSQIDDRLRQANLIDGMTTYTTVSLIVALYYFSSSSDLSPQRQIAL